jgi:PAS domain S-box-containing protein
MWQNKLKELQEENRLLKKEVALLKGRSSPEENTLLATQTDWSQFKNLCDHLQLPLTIFSDFEGSGIEYCNIAWLKITGYSLHEIHLINPVFLVHPDHKKIVTDKIKQRLDGDHQDYSYQIQIRTKHVGFKWVNLTTSVVKFNGQLRTMVLTKDISYEKEYTDSIVKAKETFKSLFNESQIIKLIIDDHTNRIIDVNNAAIDFFEFSKEEFLEKSVYDIWECSSEDIIDLKQISTAGNIVKHKKFIRKNKEAFDAELTVSSMKLGDKAVYLFSLTDITQRKVIEKELIESEAKYKAIVDNNYDCIYIYKDDKILFANERMYSLTGYSQAEFATLDFWNLIHPDDKGKIKKYASDRIRGIPTANHYQGRVICKGGVVKECEFNVAVIKYVADYVILGVVKDISDRVNAAKELKEKERFLSTLISNLNGAVYRCKDDQFWTMLYLSDAIYKLSGYAKEDFLGNSKQRFADIIHPDDKEAIAIAIKDKYSFSVEYRIICKDKTVKWVWEQGVRIVNEENEIYLEGIITDISNFKDVQHILLSSEQKFKNLFNSIKSIVAIVGEDGKMLEFNPATLVLLKKDEKTLKELSVSELGLINEEYSLEQIVGEVSNAREVLMETKVELANNTIIELAVQMSSVDYGDKKCILLVARDVTERNKFHKAMRESAALYRTIFGNTGTAICITNSLGEILLVNTKFKELGCLNGNYQKGERKIYDFIPNLGFREGKEKEKLELLEVNHGEFVFVDMAGSHKTVVSTVKNIEITGNFVISLLDISKQKSVESDLKKLNEELEIRVQERTQQLSIANNYKSEFLANMSHEIRTPLNVILGFSHLLSNKIDDSLCNSYLQSILVSGKNLLSLINDTLDLSKIEAGKFEICKEPVSISMIVNDLENMFQLRADAKGLDLSISIHNLLKEDNIFIYVDGNRLKQILVNLIGNAIKFTSQGFVKLLVMIKPAEKENCAEVIFQVEDSGIGIAQDFLAQVFEPFSQEERFADNSKSGTGLGLSISKKLIELMDGHLSVISKEGEGSTFTVKLGDVAIERSEEVAQAIEINNNPRDRYVFKDATVLIVDDIQLNRDYLSNVLIDLNLSVLEACDGVEALEILSKETVDLVITDIKMPRKDGISLLQDVRNLDRLNHIPVIAVTAIVNRKKSEENEAEFSSYIFKPYSISDMIEQLIKFLPYSEKETINIRSSESSELNFKVLKPAILDQMCEKIIPTYHIIKERQGQSEVKQFGYDLIQIGEVNKESLLINYGKEVVVSMEQFDIAKLLEGFKWFGSLLEYNKIAVSSN